MVYKSSVLASGGGGGGVSSFNTRTGAVTLTSGDVTTALGFTPGQAVTGTAGSVLFIGSGGDITEDNANFFWDDTNFRLGIGTTTPDYPLEIVDDNIGSTGFHILNANAGESAEIQNRLENNAGYLAYYGISSTNFSGYPPLDGGTSFFGGYRQPVSIFTQSAYPINFYINSTFVGSFEVSGGFSVGSNAPAVSSTYASTNVFQGINSVGSKSDENVLAVTTNDATNPLGFIVELNGANNLVTLNPNILGIATAPLLIAPSDSAIPGVGIGYPDGTLPAYTLDVNGTGNFTGNISTGADLFIANATFFGNTGAYIDINGNLVNFASVSFDSGAIFSNGSGDLTVVSLNSNFIQFVGGNMLFPNGAYADASGDLLNFQTIGANNFSGGTFSGTFDYSPGAPSDWAGTPPSDIATAVDRLAAWINANSSVFGTLGITTQP